MTAPANDTAVFIDTNVWIYAFIFEGATIKKHEAANMVIRQENVQISVQVINEICANLLKAKFAEQRIRGLIGSLYQHFKVIPLDETILFGASKMRESHHFSFWDSLIVSAALAVKARILYSEDMQDGLLVSGSLRIINPFKQIRT